MITIFGLEGTNWQAECRSASRDIIIWKGNEIKEIVRGDTAHNRNEKAHEWFTENVPEYEDSKMIRIQ